MNVLFIGNSYTGCNNLPLVFEELCASRGIESRTRAFTPGGRTLTWHLKQEATMAALSAGGWDVVVLQDQSLRALQNPAALHSAVAEFAENIRRIHATPVLYTTWARQHKPEMQETITTVYRSAAVAVNATIAPVGPAWKLALRRTPGLVLHNEDRSHPNVQGTYLAACVFFATLTGQTPLGLPDRFRVHENAFGQVDREVLSDLQEAAWEAVQALPERLASEAETG